MNEYQKALANISSDLHRGENTTTTGDMFLLQELVDKATPLRPYRQYEIDWGMGNAGECSDCKNLVNYQNSYCGKCGQKLDWSDRSE